MPVASINCHLSRGLKSVLRFLQTGREHAIRERRHLTHHGITKLLRRVYYPAYTFTGYDEGTAAIDRSTRGQKFGSMVDSAACAIVLRYRDRLTRHIGGHLKTRPELRAMLHGVNEAYARRLLSALLRYGFTPIDAQVPVTSADAPLRTEVDIVCHDDAGGGVVLIELKCGFCGYRTRAHGKMRHELSDHSDSPETQHHLQLALTTRMFRQTYTDISRIQAFVVYCDDRGVTRQALRPWAARVAKVATLRLARNAK